MKNYISISIFLVGLMSVLACNQSNEKRIVGTWQITKVVQSGKDISSAYISSNYTETYTSDGNYNYSGQPDGKSGEGKYSWDGSNTFKRSGVSGQSSIDGVIKNLTSKELDYTTTLSGESWEFVFSRK